MKYIYSTLTPGRPKVQPTVATKKRRPPYKKPQSIKQLEELFFIQKQQLKPNNPAVLKPNLRDDSANGLTDCICKYLTLNGCFCSRINTQGNYNMKLKRWVYSGCTKGVADINAVINGKSFQIEVKIGSDKPSDHQLKVKQQVEASGGCYIFVKSFDDFLKQINDYLIRTE